MSTYTIIILLIFTVSCLALIGEIIVYPIRRETHQMRERLIKMVLWTVFTIFISTILLLLKLLQTLINTLL